MTIKSRYRAVWPMNVYNTAFTCDQVITELLSVIYRKICNIMHQLRSRKFNYGKLLYSEKLNF